MKFIHSLTLTFAMCLTAFGATPSFQSFDTNDFVTTPSLSNPKVIHANKGTVGITNLYVTNLYVTNLFIGNTNYYDPTQFAYDPAGDNTVHIKEFSQTTNIVVNGLYSERQFMFQGNTSQTLPLGVSDIAVTGIGTVLLSGTTTNPADTTVNCDNGNGFGQLLIIANRSTNKFTWPATQAQTGDPTKTNYLTSDWVPASIGESIWLYNNGFGFVEIARPPGPTTVAATNYWTIIAGVLQPVDTLFRFGLGTNATFSMRGTNNTSSLTISVQDNASAILTPQDTIQLGAGVNALVLDTTSLVASAGFAPYAIDLGTKVTAFNNFWSLATNHIIGYYPGGITDYSGVDFSHTGTNGYPLYLSIGDGNAGEPRPHHFDTDNTVTSGNLLEVANNGTLEVAAGTGPQINFGVGSTNALKLESGSLVYTNGQAQADLVTRNSSLAEAHLSITAGNQAYVHPSGTGAGLALGDGTATNDVVLVGGALQSANSNVALGTTSAPWAGMHLTNALTSTNYIYFGTNTLSVQGSDIYWNSTKLN